MRALDEYARHAGRIDDMGLRILPADGQVARASHEVRRGAGLLINDSISVAMMLKDGIRAIATQDRDLKRVAGFKYTWPTISDTADSSGSETSVELR